MALRRGLGLQAAAESAGHLPTTARSHSTTRIRPVNARGVALWHHNGQDLYNPLGIARYGLDLLNSYPSNPDAGLPRSRRDECELPHQHGCFAQRGALLSIPLPFRAVWERPRPHAPAVVLGDGSRCGALVFVRLHALTGERRWLTAANGTFATFVKRRSARRPWIAFVPHKYLWFELAPKKPPTQGLAGHMAGLFSVYEYALATGSPTAAKVFDGGATAIRHQVHRFRVRGGISYVSLRVHEQNPQYHCYHIHDLKLLARMTGASWFVREARRFAADAPRACSQVRPLRRAFPRLRPSRHPRSASHHYQYAPHDPARIEPGPILSAASVALGEASLAA
jgi:D-glucuronyl C5-epimerase-like protein